MKLTFSLPIPPSINHSYRRATVNGRRMQLLTNKARAWQDDAALIATDAANRSGWTCPVGEKVVVCIWYYWPDKRRRDPNNCHKLIADALEGICYDDDRHALIRDMDYETDRGNPRVEVTVERKGKGV